MHKLALLTAGILSTSAFACADQWSPENWVLNPDEDIPVLGFAISSDSSRYINLSIVKSRESIATFKLERPKENHTWVFNNCQINRHQDPLLIAVAYLPDSELDPQWTSRLTAAYRINLKSKKLDATSLDRVRCFVGH